MIKIKLPLFFLKKNKRVKDKRISYSLNTFLRDLSGTFINYGKGKTGKHSYLYQAKEFLQYEVREQLLFQQKIPENSYPCSVKLTIFRATNRQADLDNYIILIKFALDEIKKSHITDDSYKYINKLEIEDGGLDRENPRAELKIWKEN